MLRPFELFRKIQTVEYKTVGDDTQYAIITDDTDCCIYLLFQQSNSKRDWLHNFDFPVKPYKQQVNKLLYHGGYCKVWKKCNDVIMEDLKNTMTEHPTYTIIVSGWSLGGALAIIAAEEITFRFNRLSWLITFGAPKVCYGHKTKKTILDSCYNIFEYINNNDLVPFMPPFLGYCHVKKIYVGEPFNFIDWFNPQLYHCLYGEESIY